MADDTTQKTPIRVRLNARDISFLKNDLHIKKNTYICACQDSTFWRMYHNINYQTMRELREKKECKSSSLFLPSSPDAFYSVFKLDGIYFVTMYYAKALAIWDASITGGKIMSLTKLLSKLGKGKPFFFRNFYLS